MPSSRLIAEDEGIDKIKLPADCRGRRQLLGGIATSGGRHRPTSRKTGSASTSGRSPHEAFAELIRESASVFWNGPMGVFEWEAYRNGTEMVARAMGECPGFTASGAATRRLRCVSSGWRAPFRHLSTGGGAGLELWKAGFFPVWRFWKDGLDDRPQAADRRQLEDERQPSRSDPDDAEALIPAGVG